MSNTQKKGASAHPDAERADAHEDSSVVPFRELDTLESTIPPTPLRDLLAAEGASVYALSDDDALITIVQEAGGEQYPVFAAASWRALRDAVVERRCGIVLLDLDAISGALVDRLAELSKLNPALVLLVASTRDRADGLLELLSRRKIHRLLIKPPTVGITRLLLESAVNRHIELKRRNEVQRPAPPAPPSSRLARGTSWVLAGLVVLGSVGGVGVVSYLNRAGDSATAVIAGPAEQPSVAQPQPLPVTPSANPSQGPASSLGPVAPLSTPSSVSASASEFGGVELPGVSAGEPLPLDQLGSGADVAVPAVPQGPDPEELEARYAAIEEALLNDSLDDAQGLLDELADLDQDSSRATFLQSQLDRARALAAEVAAAEAVAAEAASAPSEQTSLIGLARARLTQAQITTPPGDSAVDYYNRARALDPAAPEIQVLAGELGAAVLTAAEVELAASRFAAAESLFVMARDLGVSDANLAGLELSLALARESLARQDQDALLVTARQRFDQGQIFTPAGQSALDAVLEVDRLNPGHPGLPQALEDLRAAIQAAATEFLQADDWDRAAVAIDALARAGAPGAILDALDADLVFGSRQQAYLAEAAPAGELTVLEAVAPVFPGRAIARGVEGWVDLEFVVDTEGIPRDIVVVGAEPPDLFEEAAVAAAEGYVFAPFEQDGRIYARRAQVRMRFAFE